MKTGNQEMLYGEDAFSAKIVSLRMRITPYYIAAFVTLKIPWRNDYDVAFADPNAPFHFASDSAKAFFAVLALNQNTVETE